LRLLRVVDQPDCASAINTDPVHGEGASGGNHL